MVPSTFNVLGEALLVCFRSNLIQRGDQVVLHKACLRTTRSKVGLLKGYLKSSSCPLRIVLLTIGLPVWPISVKIANGEQTVVPQVRAFCDISGLHTVDGRNPFRTIQETLE